MQKPDLKKALYAGTLYIEKEGFALLGADFEINPDYLDIAAEEAARARKSQIRKYILFAGVFTLSVVGVVLAVLFRPREDKNDRGYLDMQITRDKIREIVENPLDVRAAQFQTSMKYEQKAKDAFKTRHDEPGNIYRCVKLFKLSLAYRDNRRGSAEVAQNFATAKQELAQAICRRYEDGFVDERNRNWPRARENFEAILRLYPVKEEPEPEVSNPIWQMAVEHITYIAQQQSKLKKR